MARRFGEHGFANAWRTVKQDIVPSRNGDGQGALGAILANDLVERNVLMFIFFGIFYNLF